MISRFFPHSNMKETETFYFFQCKIDFYIKTTCPCNQGALAGQLCTDVEQKKTMRKGTFFRAGQCAALSSFRVGKMLLL